MVLKTKEYFANKPVNKRDRREEQKNALENAKFLVNHFDLSIDHVEAAGMGKGKEAAKVDFNLSGGLLESDEEIDLEDIKDCLKPRAPNHSCLACLQ